MDGAKRRSLSLRVVAWLYLLCFVIFSGLQVPSAIRAMKDFSVVSLVMTLVVVAVSVPLVYLLRLVKPLQKDLDSMGPDDRDTPSGLGNRWSSHQEAWKQWGWTAFWTLTIPLWFMAPSEVVLERHNYVWPELGFVPIVAIVLMVLFLLGMTLMWLLYVLLIEAAFVALTYQVEGAAVASSLVVGIVLALYFLRFRLKYVHQVQWLNADS